MASNTSNSAPLEKTSTNWSALFVAPNIASRACFYCGSTSQRTKKNIDVQIVEAVTQRQREVGIRDVVQRTMANLITTAKVFDTEQLVVCMCCHHWINRRKKQETCFVPMQMVMWWLRLFDMPCHKNIDARVFHRLATAICSGTPRNFYQTLFNDEELRLLYQISSESPKNVHRFVAVFYHSQNIHSLWLPSSSIAERIRENYHDDRIKKKHLSLSPTH